MLAHILVSKYDDHLPLYRQAEIFAREGVGLETSTLSGWVGATAAALKPLVDALAAEIMASDTLHVDDTPVPVLAPGTGKTKTGRLWVYVRDERPFAGAQPPAALFRYSADRKGEHPRTHLKAFTGVIHADGYAGFNELFAGNIAASPDAPSAAGLRAALNDLRRRGVAQPRGRLLTLQPPPISMPLAARQWSQWVSETRDWVLAELPDSSLRVHAARQLAFLNTEKMSRRW